MPGTRDPLTGLLRRDSFSRRLSELCSSQGEEQSVFCLAVIDIDHFKSINDGFGHSRGDNVLSEFGERMRSVSREDDFLYRYGGDEFTVLLPGSTIDESRAFTERLLSRCTEKVFDGDPPLSVTLSIGVAQFPDDGPTAREIFDAADRRLFLAKRQGRNRIVTADQPERAEEGTGVETRLLGREKELSQFMSFTREVAERGRGFFLVLGPDGAGKSCFLDSVASYLSLGDYRVLELTGSGEVHSPLHTLAEALGCPQTPEDVSSALKEHSRDSLSLGFILKDMHMMDTPSIDAVRSFARDYNGWMAVAASTERPAASGSVGFGGVSSSVRLGPVSLEDCRAWFRAVHMWNPPEDFLQWFHSETAGLPGLFHLGVSHLERRGYLAGTGPSLRIEEGYREFALGSRMAFGSTAEINNLPVNLTPFVGRESELDRIRNLLDGGHRLITLRGMSGMGCRRLAIRAAGLNEFMFPAGVCIVDCLEDKGSASERIASELSLPSGRDALETICSFIDSSSMLIILANASRKEARMASALLGRCQGVTVMLTSREAMDLTGEAIVPVEGLSTARPDEGNPSDAARLFLQTVERLAGISGGEELNLVLVEEICSLLGGAPLAIELAASWTRVMSPAAICRRIRANPSFLAGGGAEGEEDGLSDIFQQSWEQLKDQERHAIMRLTVFAGHFTVEEAEEISDTPPETVLSLVDRSLLARDDMGIYIPAMTRDFILHEKSGSSRGFEVAREMHCRYFASRTFAFGELVISGREAARGLDGIRSAFEDISLAWELAVEKRRFRFLRQMLMPLVVYCVKKGRFRTGYSMMEEAVRESGGLMKPGLHSLVLACQALLAFKSGRTEESDRLASKALNLSGSLKDGDRGMTLLLSGLIMLERGALEGAEEHIERAMTILGASELRQETLEAELALVEYHILRGDYKLAGKILPGLSERCREQGFRRGDWETRLFMGRLALADGDLRRARDSFLSYLSAVRASGYTGNAAEVLNMVAEVEAKLGNLRQAEQYLASSADYFRRVGSVKGQAFIKLTRADINWRKGRWSEVLRDYTDALNLGEKVRNETVVTAALTGLARFHVKNGDHKRAETFLKRAAETACRSAGEPVQTRVLAEFAALDRLNGRPMRAATTALALLHLPSADSECHSACMEILREVRGEVGNQEVESRKTEASQMSVQDLMELYQAGAVRGIDSIYRKGK